MNELETLRARVRELEAEVAHLRLFAPAQKSKATLPRPVTLREPDPDFWHLGESIQQVG